MKDYLLGVMLGTGLVMVAWSLGLNGWKAFQFSIGGIILLISITETVWSVKEKRLKRNK